MRPTPIVLALLLALASAAAAQAAPTGADPGPMDVRSPAAERLLDEGRALLVAFRLGEAEAAFERLRAAEPQALAAPYHLTRIAWLRALVTEQDGFTEEFFRRADAFVAQLQSAPDGPWTRQFRGETELYRAMLLARRGEHLRAANALRQAYGQFSRLTRDHPTFEEARWGMGLCYATVGSVPRQYRWALRVLGFRGTVEQGIAEVSRSATRSRFYRDDASLLLALLDESLNESRAGGMRHLRAAAARHPESPFFQLALGLSLLSERRAGDAEQALRRAERGLARPGVHPLPHVDYYLADAVMRQGRWTDAAELFERFLARHPGRANRAQAAVRAGLAREMAGDRAAAVRHYRSISVREDFDSDASARREADARLAGPMTERDRVLLRGRMAYDGGRYREAVQIVQPLLADGSAPALARAEAAYRSGRAFQALREWDEAVRHYRFAVENPGDPLAKWGPWSQFYIGEVEAARGDRAAARAAYEASLAYQQRFEFHKGLEQRARTALARL